MISGLIIISELIKNRRLYFRNPYVESLPGKMVRLEFALSYMSKPRGGEVGSGQETRLATRW